jgi:hypothetical protein|tara:strand:+ start:3397 stop:3816 length:420 start_codon:yes stop_codon:yes gene_type:complete
MKKAEFKKLIKPLVKECIQEALLEEGLLANVIAEVVKGLGAGQKPIVEQKENNDEIAKIQVEEKKKRARHIEETRKKMLTAVNASAYNGVDLFEGTTPAPTDTKPGSAMAGTAPNDPGVDISSLLGNQQAWKTLASGKK